MPSYHIWFYTLFSTIRALNNFVCCGSRLTFSRVIIMFPIFFYTLCSFLDGFFCEKLPISLFT